MSATMVLLVVRGPEAGARLVIRAIPQIVGRSRSAGLVLSDRGVSRQHLEVTAADGGATVRCCEGASPFLMNGTEATSAVVRPGDTVVLADTALGVLIADSAPSAMEGTTVAGLFHGFAADVKSLRSITDLLTALDGVADSLGIDGALGTWAATHAAATSVRVVRAETLASDRDFAALAEGAANVASAARGARACEVAVPAHGPSPFAVLFALPIGTSAVSEELLRLLAVAGRVTGSALSRIAMHRALEEDVASLRAMALGSSRSFLGSSPAAAEVTRLVGRLAASDVTALVLGESGTGKSFVARLIHEESKRAKEPFRVINCAAIPENLVESVLFGHERGAFSGAVAAHVGALESAGRGTLLLDEIGELAPASQAKLLRALEERRFERVGSNRSLTFEARILAATNRDLREMVRTGRFREDLFYRVSVISIAIPALRERGDDVIRLATQILTDLAHTAGRRVTGFAPGALAALRAYPWPGNVRELRNVIEHALVLGDSKEIEVSDLPETVRAVARPPRDDEDVSGDTVRLPARLDALEARAIEAALRTTGGNRTKAAAILGINRVTLYKKLREEEP